MKYLQIEVRRDAYSPDEAWGTLTVSELIELLENYDGDMKVVLSNDNGYSYGAIIEQNIDVAYYESEEEE